MGTFMKKGVCSKQRIVYGIVTVSEKGQIVIPVDARRDLDIKTGDKLIVLKRKDEAGLTLIKLDKMDELMFLLQEDEEFFKKLKGGDRR
jgi:AbrB family looped-hinge helix DNA binding protein